MAGLWAQTFLLTGLMLDAIRGRRPTSTPASATGARVRSRVRSTASSSCCWSSCAGLAADARCSGRSSPLAPALTALLAGTLLYPLGRTLIESFDGRAPFFHRLRANAAERDRLCARPRGRLRPRRWRSCSTCRMRGSWLRFLFGAAHRRPGLCRRRSRCATCAPSARASASSCRSGASMPWARLLGGIVGGAVAWYLDAAQVAVIAAKLAAYATVHAPGRPTTSSIRCSANGAP